jgi:hypothetical protein
MNPMRLLILILFLMILRTSIRSLIQNLIYGHYEGQIQILNLSLPILLVALVLLIEKEDQSRILIRSPMAQPLFPRWIDVS